MQQLQQKWLRKPLSAELWGTTEHEEGERCSWSTWTPLFKKMEYQEFTIQSNPEQVLRLLDATPQSSAYDQVVEAYDTLSPQAVQMMHPSAALEFAEIPAELATEKIAVGTRALFVILTLGKEISAWSAALFAQGDYLEGMVVDAIADDALFQTMERMKPVIRKACEEKGFGITARLEAPEDLPMEAQRVGVAVTQAQRTLGVTLTSGCMLDPVKSACQVYLLSQDCKTFHLEHDCRSCPNRTCKLRTPSAISLEVDTDGGQVKLTTTREASVLELLREQNIYVPAICAGRGACGKCRMQLLEGELAPSEADRRMFTQEQLGQGWRLACTAYPKGSLRIRIGDSLEEQMEILGDMQATADRTKIAAAAKTMLAVDIGTTTIAMNLADLTTGEVLDSFLTINRQRKFGADVISRIQASNEGNKAALQRSICEDLKQGTEQLTQHGKIVPEKLMVAGNTTMIHLLMAYPCDTLGVYPFTPYQIGEIRTTIGKLFACCGCRESLKQVPVMILPGITTFVGADIVSDLVACQMASTEKVSMLIDLGTNGEMALGNKDRILVTSTAAGPAFEGGNITCGTGSVPGAICSVTIADGKAQVQTIQDRPPIGICGTGAIEALCELRRADLVDETGLLDEDCDEDGFLLAQGANGDRICFNQKDIRELQLAKAAVRAGLETLLLRYGITVAQVDRVCIAGGFGYHVDVAKAIGIGLLPEEFASKIEVIGNGSLRGAMLCGFGDREAQLQQIVGLSTEIALSADHDFNELYMEHMCFE